MVAMLRRYDTSGVDKALDEYERTGSDLNRHLLHELREMNRNLRVYRPHLPNYLFLETDETDEDDETESSDHSSPSNHQSTPIHRKRSKSGEIVCFIPSAQRPCLDHAAPPAAVRARGDPKRSSTESEISISQQLQSLSSLSTSIVLPAPQPASAIASPTSPAEAKTVSMFEGIITFAIVDFSSIANSASTHVIAKFVNSLYAAAKDAKASVHSLTADQLHVSWNATHRVVQGGAKAARFLENLRHSTGISLPAAVWTDEAICHYAASDSEQQALLIHMPWFPQLLKLLTLAQRFQSVVVNESTAQIASYTYDCFAIDYLFSNGTLLCESSRRCPSTPPPAEETTKGWKVFELVTSRDQIEENEWMYVLNDRDTLDSAVVTNALEEALAGNMGKAKQLLTAVTAASTITRDSARQHSSARVSSLVKRLELFLTCEEV